ncbi:MAG: PhoH family protein [Calditrichaeota bacterium]|nr:MAG: PhoH family protein [Calditrichota bacterium]
MTNQNSAVEVLFKIDKVDPLILCGVSDEHLKLIETHFPVEIIARGTQLKIRGNPEVVEQVESILTEMVFIANKKKNLTINDVDTLIHIVKAESGIGEVVTPSRKKSESTKELDEVILFTRQGYVKPRSAGQQQVVEAVKRSDLVVVIGPAGTGKTYLAVALAVAALKAKEVKKIVMARPAVEAGESLGFLPGDYREKIDPYLRPLYDALEDMLPKELIKRYTEQGSIEVIPLAYMRGRTLNNAFVILDEAQNATAMQMKMFLTRLGVNSKAIVTGDITQIDLPEKTTSGLLQIQEVLQEVEGISFVYLDRGDVVRHRLVRDIIFAYDQFSQQKNKPEEDK